MDLTPGPSGDGRGRSGSAIASSRDQTVFNRPLKRANGVGHTETSRTVRQHQIALTISIVILAIWLALPFASALAWAGVLAIAEWPIAEKLRKHFPDRRILISLFLTLATALFVVLPLSLVAASLASESQGAIEWLQRAQNIGLPVPDWLSHVPLVGARLADGWRDSIGSAEAAQQLLGSINAGSALGWARTIGGEAAKETGLFLITLLALGSFLIRGEEIATQTARVSSRLFGNFGADFLLGLTEAVRRTVAGTLLVSVLEGSLIGAGYFIGGVPQPVLFTVVTTVLALVPFGAWLVFGLAGLILIGQDHLVAGIAVVVYGATIMTLGDNLVQPAVIGGAMKLPFLLALVGTFGGLAAMGLVGLFIGPVVMVALLLIWQEWTEGPSRERT